MTRAFATMFGFAVLAASAITLLWWAFEVFGAQRTPSMNDLVGIFTISTACFFALPLLSFLVAAGHAWLKERR